MAAVWAKQHRAWPPILLTASLASCSAIFGVDDVRYEDAAEAASQSASSQSSTSSSVSGTGGAGEAGAGGEAGAAEGGAAGEGGGSGAPLGSPCSASSECASRFCSDAVCCDGACDGQCQTCAGGSCHPHGLGDDPDDECSLTCDGGGACTACGAVPAIDHSGDLCPLECSGCDFGNGRCFIDCVGTNCTGDQVFCPFGWHCYVTCSGTDVCSSTEVVCPSSATQCVLECSGTIACQDAVMQCGAGACMLECLGADGDSCSDAMMNCGAQSCVAHCAASHGLDTPKQSGCTSSCNCEVNDC